MATSTPASPVSSLRASKTIAPGRDRRRHEEGEARGGLAVEAGEAAGRDRDARAADAGDEGQRLGGADPDGDRERHVLDALRPARRPGRRPTG